MKIAVIGSNGRTGRVFVAAALTAGHDIVAGVHHESRLQAHPRLTTLPCDATQQKEVAALIKDTDAVVMLLGHVRGSSPTVQTDATRVVIAEMKKAGVRRLVSLTGTGVRIKGDIIPWFDQLLNRLVEQIDPARIHDGRTHTEEIQRSELDWTIVRVLKLESHHTHDVAFTEHGPTSLWVSRTQVAQSILELLEAKTFLRSLPILSPRRSTRR